MKLIIVSVFLAAFVSTGLSFPFWGNNRNNHPVDSRLDVATFENARTDLVNKLNKIGHHLLNEHKTKEGLYVLTIKDNLNGQDLMNNLRVAVEFVLKYEKYYKDQMKSNANSILDKFDQLISLLQKVQNGLNKDGDASESIQAEIHANNVVYSVKPVFTTTLELIEKHSDSFVQNNLLGDYDFSGMFPKNMNVMVYTLFTDRIFEIFEKIEIGVQANSTLSGDVKQALHDKSESLLERMLALRVRRNFVSMFDIVEKHDEYLENFERKRPETKVGYLLFEINEAIEKLSLIVEGLRKDNLKEELKKAETVLNDMLNHSNPLFIEIAEFALSHEEYLE